MIRIDGSTGEGGGQILRTALALSVITGSEIEIFNIRKGRSKPGLMMQHLTAVKALAAISEARVEGAKPGSQELKFQPTRLKAGNYTFNVAEERGSAGSTGLVLQAMLPALLFAGDESHLTLHGGTHTQWSPPITYLEKVFCPALSLMGRHLSLRVEKWGWYPKGGGIVHAHVGAASSLKPINLTERGQLQSVSGISVISNLPIQIAERQRQQAAKTMKREGIEVSIEVRDAPSTGQGTFIMLWGRFSEGLAGFTALGEKGKRAERVADEASEGFISFLSSGPAVDAHLADQLIIYMGLAEGESAIATTEKTSHLMTNIWTVERFLPLKYTVEETQRGIIRISVKGVGHKARRHPV